MGRRRLILGAGRTAAGPLPPLAVVAAALAVVTVVVGAVSVGATVLAGAPSGPVAATRAPAPARDRSEGSSLAPASPGCAVDDSAVLNRWLAGVPDGSTVTFPPGACYGISRSLRLVDRVGLHLEGDHASFTLLPRRREATATTGTGTVWTVDGGADITLSDMTVVGDNSSRSASGTDRRCTPSGRFEWQFGIQFAGTHTATVADVNVERTCGDFIEMAPYRTAGGHVLFDRPATDITVSGGTFSVSGRQGFGLTGVSGAAINGITMSHVGQDAIDVEPDVAGEHARGITVSNSRFMDIGAGVLANFGSGGGPAVGGITVQDNTESDPLSCLPLVWGGGPGSGTPRQGYVITGNRVRPARVLAQLGPGIMDVTIAGNVDGGPDGCGTRHGVTLRDVRGASVTGNSFPSGVKGVLRHTGLHAPEACGNSLGPLTDVPVPCPAAQSRRAPGL